MPIITNQRTVAGGVLTSTGYALETNFSSPASATYYIACSSNDLALSNKITMNPQIRRSIGSPNPLIGSYSVGGTIETLLDANSGPLLRASLGTDTVTASGSQFLHTFSMTNPLPSMTLSQDDSLNSLQQFVGCKFSSSKFSIKAGDPLLAAFTVMGAAGIVIPGATNSPFFSLAPIYEFAHLGVAALGQSLLAGVPFNVSSFDMTQDTGLEEVWGSTGGRQIISLSEKNRTVKGSFVLNYDNIFGNQLNAYLYGTSSGLPAQGQILRLPIAFTFSVPTSAGGVQSALTFDLGQITIESVKVTRSRSTLMSQTVTWTASETTNVSTGIGNCDDLTISLLNNVSTAY